MKEDRGSTEEDVVKLRKMESRVKDAGRWKMLEEEVEGRDGSMGEVKGRLRKMTEMEEVVKDGRSVEI